MPRRVMGRLVVLLVAVGLALGLGGCGGDAKSNGGSIPAEPSLKGVQFKVGSKEFVEQLVLGEITTRVLTAAGAKPAPSQAIVSTAKARQALTSGTIDMYWEYTGTGWLNLLGHTTPITDSQRQFDAVAAEDFQRNKIKWLSPYAPLNNTYAIAVRTAAADRLNVHNLSDFARLTREDPKDATLCVAREFQMRPDGLPGLIKAYGIKLPPANVKVVDTGAVYADAGRGTTCNFGEVFTTDGRIVADQLTVLDDDKRFFPVYNPALTMREETFKKYPALQKVFAPVAQALDNATMLELVSQVSVDGAQPSAVADSWLRSKGFIK